MFGSVTCALAWRGAVRKTISVLIVRRRIEPGREMLSRDQSRAGFVWTAEGDFYCPAVCLSMDDARMPF